ncbi:hypothetical protein F6B42_09755 [Microbacterium radiodurans]|uniref:Uncharacterized protein n=1 Tax=Microbacterium radiodurans TaxID=661398 RepID=A0A5J5IVA7_9MICO|nr:hypothetical protein F6B42_09755 [Microbacterium radiodurans]
MRQIVRSDGAGIPISPSTRIMSTFGYRLDTRASTSLRNSLVPTFTRDREPTTTDPRLNPGTLVEDVRIKRLLPVQLGDVRSRDRDQRGQASVVVSGSEMLHDPLTSRGGSFTDQHRDRRIEEMRGVDPDGQ